MYYLIYSLRKWNVNDLSRCQRFETEEGLAKFLESLDEKEGWSYTIEHIIKGERMSMQTTKKYKFNVVHEDQVSTTTPEQCVDDPYWYGWSQRER
jgi:hypothetical protein